MLPDARQATLPGADHLRPLTRADSLAAITADFVLQRPAARTANDALGCHIDMRPRNVDGQ
jgi:hypothetical protein